MAQEIPVRFVRINNILVNPEYVESIETRRTTGETVVTMASGAKICTYTSAGEVEKLITG